MLKLTAQVLNVFQSPQGVSRDGKNYGGESKVQLQAIQLLKNGEKRVELLTLTTKTPEKFKSNLGKKVTVDVAVYGKEMAFYLPENGDVSIAAP